MEQRPWRGTFCFFTLYFMHLFIFQCACGHSEAINRQHLPTVTVPFLKLLHNIWLSLISHIHWFISSFSSAQFCFYMPGFSVADDQNRLNHFWLFTLKQKWIYFITSIYLWQHIFWSQTFFFKVVISVRNTGHSEIDLYFFNLAPFLFSLFCVL